MIRNFYFIHISANHLVIVPYGNELVVCMWVKRFIIIIIKGCQVLIFGQTFTVERIFLDSNKLLAMAHITQVDDSFTTMQLPVSRLSMCPPDFHKMTLLDTDGS